MKVEFLVNTDINDGRQIFIQEAEFKKAKDNEEEFNSFAFATNCLICILRLILMILLVHMNMRKYYQL